MCHCKYFGNQSLDCFFPIIIIQRKIFKMVQNFQWNHSILQTICDASFVNIFAGWNQSLVQEIRFYIENMRAVHLCPILYTFYQYRGWILKEMRHISSHLRHLQMKVKHASTFLICFHCNKGFRCISTTKIISIYILTLLMFNLLPFRTILNNAFPIAVETKTYLFVNHY